MNDDDDVDDTECGDHIGPIVSESSKIALKERNSTSV